MKQMIKGLLVAALAAVGLVHSAEAGFRVTRKTSAAVSQSMMAIQSATADPDAETVETSTDAKPFTVDWQGLGVTDAKDAYVMLVNERTGNAIAIQAADDGEAKTELPPLALAELERQYLGASQKYRAMAVTCDANGKESVVASRLVASCDGTVELPNFNYKDKNGLVCRTTTGDRRLVSLGKTKPSFILRDPDDTVAQQRLSLLEDAHAYYQYVYELPNGDKTLYTEKMRIGNEQPLKAVSASGSQLVFQLYGSFPNETRNAHAYALTLWATALQGTIPVRIRIDMFSFSDEYGSDMDGVIGCSWRPPLWLLSNGMAFPEALFQQLVGEDPSGDSAYDIRLEMNTDMSFYYGIDGNCPTDKIDYVTIVLHEVCHGLGFMDSIASNGALSLTHGTYAYPMPFDYYLVYNGKQIYNTNNATRKTAITSNKLYFGGSTACAGNGGSMPQLFAPATYMNGSSVCHWDWYVTFPTFMRYAYTYPLHQIGPQKIGAMQDLGWDINGTVIGLPAVPQAVFSTQGTQVGKVSLSWGGVGGATSYKVKRAESAGGPYQVVASNVQNLKHDDETVAEGIHYFYKVCAVNAAGDGADSARVEGWSKATSTLVSIEVDGPATLLANEVGTYTCTAVYSNGGRKDVSEDAGISWSLAAGASYGTMNGRKLTAGSFAENKQVTVRASFCGKMDEYNVAILPRTVKVTFNPDGGTVSPTEKTFVVDATYGSLPVPTRADYDFLGWYTAKSGGNLVTASSKVSGSVTTLWAHWSFHVKTTRVWITGDTSVATGQPLTVTCHAEDNLNAASEPTVVTWVVSGDGVRWTKNWTTDNPMTTASRTAGTADIRAIYGGVTSAVHHVEVKIVSETVTFDPNGGTVSPTRRTYTVGAPYGNLPTPVRANYDFDGWTTAKTGGEPVTAQTVCRVGVTTLYAQWTLHPTVSRLAISGPDSLTSGGTASYVCTAYFSDGTSLRVTPTWNTDRGTIANTGSFTAPTVTAAVNATILASYMFEGKTVVDEKTVTINPQMVSVAFNANGGTVSPSSKTFTVGLAYGTLPTPTRSQYVFDGWYTELGGGSKVIGATICTAAVKTLYARWTYIDLSRIVISGASSLVSGQSATYTCRATYTDNSSADVTPNWTASAGTITASGVFTAPTVTAVATVTVGASYKSGSTTKTDSFAVTVNPQQVTVTFDACGGQVSPTAKAFVVGLAYGSLPTPSRTDYDFLGWYTEMTGGFLVTSSMLCQQAVSRLYAHWKPVVKLVSLQIAGTNEVVSLEAMTNGCTGVYSDGSRHPISPVWAASTGVIFEDGVYFAPTVTVATVVRLTATFSSVSAFKDITVRPRKVTVAFDANAGGAVADPAAHEYTVWLAYGELPTIVWDGYLFEGWFTEPSGGDEVTASTVCEESVGRLYARWMRRVVIDRVVVVGADSVESGARSDYRCDAYYSDGTKQEGVAAAWTASKGSITSSGSFVAPAVTATTAVALTATYAGMTGQKNVSVLPKRTTVMFNAHGGTVSPSSKSYTVGLAYGDLPTPTRSGDWRFDGWFTAEKGGTHVTTATVCTESVRVLHAQWQFVKKLDNLVLSGPDEVVSGRQAEYVCTAYYNDGTTVEVSSPTWAATAGDMATDGTFTAPLVTVASDIVISAEYTSGDVTKTAAKTVRVKPIALRVTLDANGGAVEPAFLDCVVGLPYGPLPTPVWTGRREHAFDGWFASTEATKRVAVTEATIATEAVTNLVAAWHEVVKLDGVAVAGPLSVESEGHARYVCWAHYSNGTSNDVSTVATWRISRGEDYAAVDGTGFLTAAKVTENKDVLLSVSFGGVTVSRNLTIVPKRVTVTFVPHEGMVSPGSRTYVVGLAYGSFPVAQRAHYRFQGWFTAAAGGERVMESDLADADTTVLHAQWLENPPALKAIAIRGANSVAGGGSAAYYCVATWTNGLAESTTTLTGAEVTWSVRPASAGTIRDGVFAPVRVADDVAVTVCAAYQSAQATVSVTVRAEKLTVTFNPNGGRVAEASRVCAVGFAYGALPVPEREDHRFDGWFTAAAGGRLVTESTLCEKGVGTLYAHWTEIPHLTGLVIVGDAVVTSGVAVAYRCLGVYSDDSEVLVSPQWSVEGPEQGQIDEDGTLVAAFVPETTNLLVVAAFENQTNTIGVLVEPRLVSVFFDPQNGAVAPQRVEYVVGSPYGELPVPTRNKYAFDGWFTREAKAGDRVTEATVADLGTTVLYAGWTPEASALTGIRIEGVSKVASGGIAQFACKAIHMDGSESSVAPQWSVIGGLDWGFIAVSGFFTAETVSEDKVVTIRAAYTEKGIRYEDEHDVVVTTSALVVNPDSVSLESASQSATLFVDAIGSWTVATDADWITLKKTSGSEIDSVDFSVTANVGTEERYGTITVTCGSLVETCEVKQYSAIPDEYVTVSLDPQVVGQDVSARTYIRGRKFGYLPTPVRAGYAFGGWWTQSGGRGTQCHPLTIVTDETLNLYAHWTNMTVAYALNNALDWVQDPTHPWTYDYVTSADRKLSMCSPALGNDQRSSLSALVEGPGTISFYWKSSSEEFFDTLSFYVDGKFVASVSGESGWKLSSKAIQTFGPHVLTWTYEKDGKSMAGADCGWLDLVTWLPNYSGSGASSISSSDGKSLPESWINANGLEASPSTVSEDPDGDGMTNFEEYKAGTDPLDPESCFKVFIDLDADGKPSVDVISGRAYILEGKASLDDDRWEPADREVHKFFRATLESK